jgi:hypothetical protein
MPQLRVVEVRGVQTHLHLLDINGNGTLEFRELLVVSGCWVCVGGCTHTCDTNKGHVCQGGRLLVHAAAACLP